MAKKFFYVFLFSLIPSLFACNTDSGVDDEEPSNAADQEAVEEGEEIEMLADIDYDISWAEDSIFYQVLVRSFSDGSGDGIGDFAGLRERVPYFTDLGIDALWLMPIYQANSYHGYDVEDYYSIDSDLGTMADFEEFLQEAQDNDVKVIIDFVVNHTSDEHEWFQEALNNPESEYRDYYIWEDHETYEGQEIGEEEGWYEVDGQIYSGHYNVDMPDLNFRNPAVRQEVKDIASFWLDKGVDGFRLDGVPEIDDDVQETYAWWREFNAHVKSENPEAFIVGENWFHTTEEITPFYSTMESSFNFVLAEEILGMANGMSVDIVEELDQIHADYERVSSPRGQDLIIDSTIIGNHDMDRVVTRLQNDRDKAKLAANLQFTLPGTPFIYYGEELGQEGQLPNSNRREPFDWYADASGPGMTEMDDNFDSSSEYTIANDGISLEEQEGDSDSMYEHYRRLISIRQSNPMFFTGEYETIGTEFGLYGYTINHTDDDYQLTVVHNQRDEERTVNVEAAAVDLYSNAEYQAGETITLQPYSSVILESPTDQIPVEEVVSEEPEEDYSVTYRVTVPEETPSDDNIYLVGEFNSWDPEDEDYILEEVGENTYEITMEDRAYSMTQYKFTRGGWGTREQNSAGEDLIGERQMENRVYSFTEDDRVEEITIERWADN